MAFDHEREHLPTKADYKQEAVMDFAKAVKAQGFTVYLSESKTHGFYTNQEGKRVISFQYDLGGGVSLSGNYKASREGGTGWKMGALNSMSTAILEQVLNSAAPSWANKNPVYTTVNQHLAIYGDCCEYSQL